MGCAVDWDMEWDAEWDANEGWKVLTSLLARCGVMSRSMVHCNDEEI